jgi:hypothetical protein
MGYVRAWRAPRSAPVRGSRRACARPGCRDTGGWRVRRHAAPYTHVRSCWRPTPTPTTSGPGSRKGFTLIPYFQLATEPLGDAADTILPGRQGLWDTAQIMTSLRKDRPGG